MAIKALYPKKLNLPHIGEASVRFLTINSIIWAKENEAKPPYEFIADYLERFGETTDGGSVFASQLTKPQLDDIATALEESFKERLGLEDNATPITNADAFKTFVLDKAAETEKRSAEVMKRIFSRTSIGRLQTIVGQTQSPAQRLIKSIDPLGLKAIQKSLNPEWLKTIQSAMSITQSVQESLKPLVGLGDIGASLAIANNLALPGAEIALLSKQISNQFRVSDLQIGAVMDANRLGRFSETFLNQSLKLPGFNATARAGVVGLANKSVASEILARYTDQDIGKTTPIGVAMRTIRELDIVDAEDFDTLSDLAETASQSMGEINPHHKFNLIQFLILIIAVISLIITLSDDSGETQKEVLKEVTALHQTLIAEFNADDEAFKYDRMLTGTFYLREGGSTDTPSIMLLNKGRIVREMRVKDGWAYVEVLPYGDEKSIYGWVYRGGLSHLP